MHFNNNIFNLLIVVLTVHLVPVELEKYDLIIIPVPKGRIEKLAARYDNPWTSANRHQIEFNHNERDLRKLDVEQYDAPTEVPDLDDFDFYGNGRNTLRDDSDHFEENDNFDDDNLGNQRIVGGNEVDINFYPYHVGYGTNCGGAIIDKKYVLTAGHCGKKPYIRAGSKYLNQGQKVLVKNHIIHPGWSAKSKEHPFDFDFQILELMEPLQFSENIQPIKVAHIEDMVIGKVITVTGWGNTEENGPYSSVLRAVRVPIISKEHCQTVPFPYFRGALTARMFCAGFSEGKKDACQGDSGGPAVSNGRLLGTVSFGYGCATPGSYGVYSKIAKVRDWIESHTGLRLQ
ncbi:hypothetical protein O0L34_g10900 [Tuta absoluta]|nr:hypothetical protein O0L34_g10900 [Tuta absoluta]